MTYEKMLQVHPYNFVLHSLIKGEIKSVVMKFIHSYLKNNNLYSKFTGNTPESIFNDLFRVLLMKKKIPTKDVHINAELVVLIKTIVKKNLKKNKKYKEVVRDDALEFKLLPEEFNNLEKQIDKEYFLEQLNELKPIAVSDETEEKVFNTLVEIYQSEDTSKINEKLGKAIGTDAKTAERLKRTLFNRIKNHKNKLLNKNNNSKKLRS